MVWTEKTYSFQRRWSSNKHQDKKNPNSPEMKRTLRSHPPILRFLSISYFLLDVATWGSCYRPTGAPGGAPDTAEKSDGGLSMPQLQIGELWGFWKCSTWPPSPGKWIRTWPMAVDGKNKALFSMNRGWDWCPSGSHHPTTGDMNSNRYFKVMWNQSPKRDINPNPCWRCEMTWN